jgi:ribosomal-protein-alanine N-acetyltransferase
MLRREAAAVLAIDRLCYETPWLASELEAIRESRDAWLYVAEAGKAEAVVGYMAVERRRNTLHLLRLGVAPPWRRQGIGGQLAAKLISLLSVRDPSLAIACVDERQTSGHKFLSACEWTATGVEPAYFVDGDERRDAYRFVFEV